MDDSTDDVLRAPVRKRRGPPSVLDAAVLRGVDRFGGRSSLKTWLYRSLVNRAKTAGQRDRRCIPDPPFSPQDLAGSEPAVGHERFYDVSHPQWAGRWKQAPDPVGVQRRRSLTTGGRAVGR